MSRLTSMARSGTRRFKADQRLRQSILESKMLKLVDEEDNQRDEEEKEMNELDCDSKMVQMDEFEPDAYDRRVCLPSKLLHDVSPFTLIQVCGTLVMVRYMRQKKKMG
uniref:AlNc14C2G248 protein n=1 Tax=Albugo laibachii Nc14 TaxID=890382 RepID=F0VZA7_9STRA|nr:AlNc14C2G248 [Albugo laibachii Nc14]|eukprot:CCA14137.1 AlNc14C2G248 [Albugo laibachii Nc14]